MKELERALGNPIDRAYLVFWVSRGIADCVRLSTQPTPREARLELLKIAGEGRDWINRIQGFSGSFLLGELSELTTTVTRFCDRADFAAGRAQAPNQGWSSAHSLPARRVFAKYDRHCQEGQGSSEHARPGGT